MIHPKSLSSPGQGKCEMLGLKRLRRAKLRKQPFPVEWEKILQKCVRYYQRLSPEDQAELRGHIQVFIAEKTFEGAGGLKMSDRIKVVIAAQACILLLHRETDYYPTLHTILVYPHPYIAPVKKRLAGGLVEEGEQGRLGESWFKGAVVLSWDEVQRTAHDHNDPHNVVFHEFAHQLDSESGANDGAPRLQHDSMYIAWARVLGTEYKRLLTKLRQHLPTDLDPYGATNPAEFFAVVTEAFFEQPAQLKALHPLLYDQLRQFYQQDPASLD